MTKKDEPPPPDWKRVAADEDWVDRLNQALGEGRGSNEPVVKKSGLSDDRVSKARRGRGSPKIIMRISRAAEVAPPKEMFDDAQFHLLDKLETFRRVMRDRFSDPRGEPDEKAVEEEVGGLLRRFDEAIKELTGGSSPSPLPRRRAGES